MRALTAALTVVWLLTLLALPAAVGSPQPPSAAAPAAASPPPPPLPAAAPDPCREHNACARVRPPERYGRDATAVVAFVHPRFVPGTCGMAVREGFTLYACQRGDLLVLPNPCGPGFAREWFAHLACHELAHRNGWPADHPGS